MFRLNPKVDFLFKKLFASLENKDILISFINSILKENEKIKDIELKNPYSISNYVKDKMAILDIKAVDENGAVYNIEMQLADKESYSKRAFYYWIKVCSAKTEVEENYEIPRKTIAINILDFNYLNEEGFHNIYKVYNEKTRKEFSDLFETHFIELNKFNKEYKELNTALDRWIAFLNNACQLGKDSMPMELATDIAVKKAMEKIDMMPLDSEELDIYMNELERLKVCEEKSVI